MDKFKIGDKVRVLDGSKIKNYTGGWAKTMVQHVGKVYTIHSVGCNLGMRCYELDIEGVCRGCLWDERGLERVGEPKYKFSVGDVVIAHEDAPYLFTCDGWTGEVIGVHSHGFDATGEYGSFHGLNYEHFDRVRKKIVITSEGKVVKATMYCNNVNVGEGIAKCHPSDTFGFETGAKLAFERLVDVKEKFYNGQIFIIKGDNEFLTGHIYEIIGGKIRSEQGAVYPLNKDVGFHSIEEVFEYFKSKDVRDKKKFSYHYSHDGIKCAEVAK